MKEKTKQLIIAMAGTAATLMCVIGIITFVNTASLLNKCEKQCMPVHTDDWVCEITCLKEEGAPKIFWAE